MRYGVPRAQSLINFNPTTNEFKDKSAHTTSSTICAVEPEETVKPIKSVSNTSLDLDKKIHTELEKNRRQAQLVQMHQSQSLDVQGLRAEELLSADEDGGQQQDLGCSQNNQGTEGETKAACQTEGRDSSVAQSTEDSKNTQTIISPDAGINTSECDIHIDISEKDS